MDYAALADILFERFMNIPHMPPKKQIEGMNRGMPVILNYLMKHDEGVQPLELSSELKVTTARIAAALNTLESKGFITRKRDPADKRRTLVCLTQTGRDMGVKFRSHMRENLIEILEGLGEADAQEFVRITSRILESLEEKHKSKKHHDMDCEI